MARKKAGKTERKGPNGKGTSKRRRGERDRPPGRSAADGFRGAARAALLALAAALERDIGATVSPVRLASLARGLAPARRLEAVRRLDGFGVFAGLPSGWVLAHIDALVESGHLEPAEGAGGALTMCVSGSGRRAMGDGEPLGQLVEGDSVPVAGALSRAESAIVEALRALRARHARREGRPAFSILSNDTVRAIARRRPEHLGELAAVPGIGPERLRRYGRGILRAVKRTRPR